MAEVIVRLACRQAGEQKLTCISKGVARPFLAALLTSDLETVYHCWEQLYEQLKSIYSGNPSCSAEVLDLVCLALGVTCPIGRIDDDDNYYY